MEGTSPEELEALFGVIGLAIGLGSLVLFLAIQAFICHLLAGCFRRIPQNHRQMEPGLVWLLMIPCVNVVWNFFVFLKLSASFQSYFQEQGDTSVGDCYYSIGLIYCILVICSIVPYLGCLTGLGALVLLIIYLVKATELKNRIPEAGGAY